MWKVLLLAIIALASSSAFGHTAIMSCFDNGDGTITCEGGFSDGSSASGITFRIAQNGKSVMESKFDEHSEVTFPKPYGRFSAILDGGSGHLIEVRGENIVQ
ncbi:hypothetical protein [Chrysiogenes arsenatis]|uniref:hypothetical protein n=1 Tax=Chrysiogenes arsenatis TaxID=309797 RepID=UPI0003FDFCA9|nr:hypothetical protein [Chrysiogenes arsenatis]